MNRMPKSPHRLLLAAGLLAITASALLLVVVWRLSQTRSALAEVQANCRCCVGAIP